MRFLIGLLFSLSLLSFTQAQENKKAQTLVRFIQKAHYAPRPVDDAFSQAIFDKMLAEADPFHLYFLAPQILELEKFTLTIDDELTGGPGDFCKTFSKAFQKALQQGEKLAKEVLETPGSLPKNQVFDYSKTAPFAKDAAALKQRWQQYLQWRILTRVYENWEYLVVDSATAVLPTTQSEWYLQEEKKARAAIVKVVNQRMKEHTAEDEAKTESEIREAFLHLIAQFFDPHTDYFNDSNEKEFSRSLSSDLLEFGFSMDETEEGDLVIDQLKPGGAAWNTGNMYANDKIIQIKTKTGRVVNVKDAGYEEVSKLFDEMEQEEIELTLRSADGTTRQVKLQKQEVQNDENIVRGYLLEADKKLGYIALPSFYTGWDDQGGSGCANDLSKEIIKLKREKIEGLILDLRYNGGGSLQEAVEIAGIFIEAGPMSLLKYASGERATLKDPSRGSIYDGPLMVLVNGQSASASELVAATLQDYNRAIIMGSPTFGKATMQVVLPLDTSIITNREIDEKKYNPSKKYEDYVKVTDGKIYRVNGSANQLQGVQPDVLLPDAFEAFSYTERSMDGPLPADTMAQSVPFTPLPVLASPEKLKGLQQNVLSQPYFEALSKWVTEQKGNITNRMVPLDWAAYVLYEKNTSPPEADTTLPNPLLPNLKAMNTSYTNRLLELSDDYQKTQNGWLLEDLLTDIYIRSACFVLFRIL